jgi:hypothetical protein
MGSIILRDQNAVHFLTFQVINFSEHEGVIEIEEL